MSTNTNAETSVFADSVIAGDVGLFPPEGTGLDAFVVELAGWLPMHVDETWLTADFGCAVEAGTGEA